MGTWGHGDKATRGQGEIDGIDAIEEIDGDKVRIDGFEGRLQCIIRHDGYRFHRLIIPHPTSYIPHHTSDILDLLKS